MAAGATYEPIATTTLGSAASSYTFSSISASYTDLILVAVLTEAVANNYGVRVNSDSATNYSDTFLYGNGTSAGSGRNASGNQAQVSYYGGSSSVPTLLKIHFFNYAGSTYKTWLTEVAQDQNGAGSVERTVSLWRSTSAINSITVRNAGGNNISTGSTFTLYGIKAA